MEENPARISSAFFTVTLSKELLAKPVKSQLILSYCVLWRICANIFKSFTLTYEFTKSCNIHYHGKADVPTGDEYLFSVFQDLLKSRIFGFNKIDTINRDNGVDSYMVKDISKTESILKRLKVDISRFPIISTKESRIEGRRRKKLVVIPTHQLDILEPIIEDEDFEHYYNYNRLLK